MSEQTKPEASPRDANQQKPFINITELIGLKQLLAGIAEEEVLAADAETA